MTKLNDKHHYLVLSTNKTAEIFLPVLAKFNFEYNNKVNDLEKNSNSIIICVKNYYRNTIKKFWFAEFVSEELKTEEDILVIENCSATQLENVLHEYYDRKKTIKLYI